MRPVDRPIFVVGVDHSGATILYRMLARHPDLAWFSRCSQRGGGFPGRTWVPFHAWINRTGRKLLGVEWEKGHGRLLTSPREGVGIWRRLVPRTDGFLFATECTDEMAEAVRRTLASEQEDWRVDRMLVKVPYVTRVIGLLDRIFPDALFLHVVRDGRAVSLSNRELFLARARDPTEALRAAALDWIQTLEYVREMGERLGQRLMTLRYEDFCADVHGWLRAALRFGGLDPAALDPSSFPANIRPTNDRWLHQCAPDDKRLLNQLLLPALRRWGYESFVLAEAVDPAPGPRGGAPVGDGRPLEGTGGQGSSRTGSTLPSASA